MDSPLKRGGLLVTVASSLLSIASCGGGGTPPPPPPVTYTIGGSMSGLTASGLVLTDGTETVSPAAGSTSYVFPTALASGSAYAVTVQTQPSSELCEVVSGVGQVGTADVTNVAVSCTPPWTWVGGAKTIDANGVYGTQGAAAAANVPGARSSFVSWIDSVGNLWLFGGYGHDSAGTSGDLNDLWRYSPASGQWTWISGSNTIDATGVYGTQGAAAVGNVPGPRWGSVSWIDRAGNLWLFGGYGHDSAGVEGGLNDLWHYSPATGQWTWVGGMDTVADVGLYSSQGSPGVPGARVRCASWIDSAGKLWLFGGYGYDSAGATGVMNDLWVY